MHFNRSLPTTEIENEVIKLGSSWSAYVEWGWIHFSNPCWLIHCSVILFLVTAILSLWQVPMLKISTYWYRFRMALWWWRKHSFDREKLVRESWHECQAQHRNTNPAKLSLWLHFYSVRGSTEIKRLLQDFYWHEFISQKLIYLKDGVY